MQDTGDFINTKTGEVRDEHGFLSSGEDPDAEANAYDWGGGGDSSGNWDDIGTFDDDGSGGRGGGAYSDAQVRSSRPTDGPASSQPSKLPPKKRR